ncbi:MAG: hypothetical protein A3K03_00725 [Bdellovibrionales bacterium RIFOXYD1_FULL_44_7]|nr:MAG: hypothetical protein A3K03_00725 [Bdellovibrionales bacterium RIFOXYD1_FULL_44_7]
MNIEEASVMTKTATDQKGEKKDFSQQQGQKKEDSGYKPKGYVPLPGGCQYENCKTKTNRFGFCEEHYEQFKFGLIKKTGEPVPDYEKKFEHYAAYKTKRGAKKVA